MRIVLLAPFALAPKGTVRARALPIGRALAAAGHQVTLLIPPVDDPASAAPPYVDGGVEVRHVAVTGDSPLARLTVPARLARATVRLKPELVWAWKPFGYGATAAAYLRGAVPRIFQDADDWEGSGGWGTVNRKSWPWRLAVDAQERWLPRLADRVTVASAYLRDRFGSLVGTNRVAYLPNCLSGDERPPDPRAVADLRARHGLDDRSPAAVFAGYLPAENDLDLALEAIALARRDVPDLRLILIADGPGVGAARDRARALGLAGALIETGPVAEADLPDYLGLARVAIGPYRDTGVNRARCSVKLLHYLAAGIPVVATAVGENCQMVLSDRTGYLVDPADPPGFARAIARLAGDPAAAAEMGARGRCDVLARYRWADRLAGLVSA